MILALSVVGSASLPLLLLLPLPDPRRILAFALAPSCLRCRHPKLFPLYNLTSPHTPHNRHHANTPRIVPLPRLYHRLPPLRLRAALPPLRPPKPDTSPFYPWRSRIASAANHVDRTTLYGLARQAHDQGQPNFAHYVQHFLSNTGAEATVPVDEMMQAMPQFRAQVHQLAEFKARLAYRSLVMGGHGAVTFTSFWHEYTATSEQSWDWYLALGRFVFSVTGVVRMDEADRVAGTATVQYTVHVFDYCDWDGGRDLIIGPFRFQEHEMGVLQVVGLGREFKIRGSSQSQIVEGFVPGNEFPLPGSG
ncbi:hypothetical protein BO70DRAFT_352239 [Aspergillus heteromorphus CBS 117.55]|uniref:SnoaL-like domain-containing protein n=1 Tax=Aspergillus heteromorphus CBS 117.55 TaxID=1448321 RepID=A0A317WBP9_9EURO|nr:uncharacterized protein BO70DRAFT_352239 [Aspergillus heteromorphus CBS 117.55]PWY83375.1 hypothetical protein BO70DRAFT_352239 [Aspergillus heteromorphus CBS 117.55]